MSFVKESVNKEPLQNSAFGIVNEAKMAKKKYGFKNVFDATIGSLFNEEGKLVALDTVYNALRGLDNTVLAAYASSITGNPDFKEAVYDWALNGNSTLEHEVIATPGGTGAIGMTISECLDSGQTLIIPSIGWEAYELMAQMNNLNLVYYEMFDGDHFNIESYKEACKKVMTIQDKLVIVMNDPCHNPTGYSLSKEEWKEIVNFLNECSKTHSVVLLDDVAYIDYAYRQEMAKEYMTEFNNISENMIVVIAFSLSKSLTFYGMRCGAAIVLGKTNEAVQEVKIVFEKNARAVWSNINNGGMTSFVEIMKHHKEEYYEEKGKYITLLKERSDIFLSQADSAGLEYYPYKDGFFITLKMDNEIRDSFHEALRKQHIYTLKVNKGIRVAMCSLNIKKIDGLAIKMKQVFDSIQ